MYNNWCAIGQCTMLLVNVLCYWLMYCAIGQCTVLLVNVPCYWSMYCAMVDVVA